MSGVTQAKVAAWKSGCVISVQPSQNWLAPILSLFIADLLAALFTLLIVQLLMPLSTDVLPLMLVGFFAVWLSLFLLGLYPGRGMFGPERVRLRAIIGLLAFLPPTMVCAPMVDDKAVAVLQCVLCSFGLFCFSTFFETATISILLRRGLWRSDAVIVGDDGSALRVRRDLSLFPELGLRVANEQQPAHINDTVVVAEATPVAGNYLVNTSAPLPSFRTTAGATNIGHGNNLIPLLIKRALDIVIATVALVLLSPVLLAAALLIWCLDGRPVFFCQMRGGKGGSWIGVWKFRSMYRDAAARLEDVLAVDPAIREEWNRFFKLRNDPRILPVIGNFIRRTSIDELPQLWNVLKGDMSLIGPRPFPKNHLGVFSKEFQAERARVVPGLSGLWQVTLRSDGDVEMQELLDTAYVRGWSIWLDWYILLKTPIVLFSNRGAR